MEYEEWVTIRDGLWDAWMAAVPSSVEDFRNESLWAEHVFSYPEHAERFAEEAKKEQ
jgi:hypothetical protein